MLTETNFTRQLLLGLLLVILAVLVLTVALDAQILADLPGITAGEVHFSDFAAVDTGGPTAIASDCNGGSSGGCGGG